MPHRIREDQARFRDIVRGRVKQELGRYVQQGELLARRGGTVVSIPLPSVELPRFQVDGRQRRGVGQGEGEPGQPLPGQAAPGGGAGPAGLAPGAHALEVEFTLDELADLVGEALELPRLQPRGAARVVAGRPRYTGVAPTGPESLRHFRRTYQQALRRQVASGGYDPGRPLVIPIHADRRYRTSREAPRPEASAVVLYLMDVSGSMGEDQKAVVRTTAFWIETWLRRRYRGLVLRYLTHDAVAREVDRETFFRSRESGGTVISSAYLLALRIVEADYAGEGWNVYPFHFSDGDNSSPEDSRLCLDLLRSRLLPACNHFCYGQVESPYGSGQFLRDLREGLGQREDLAATQISGREGILPAIRAFLGSGR